jgi:hypothetical protein
VSCDQHLGCYFCVSLLLNETTERYDMPGIYGRRYRSAAESRFHKQTNLRLLPQYTGMLPPFKLGHGRDKLH